MENSEEMKDTVILRRQ